MVEILQDERLVGGFVIVESETHEQGGEYEAGIGGEEAGESYADTHKDDGDGGELVFPDEHDYENGAESEEARYFSDRLDNAYVVSVELYYIDSEVVV